MTDGESSKIKVAIADDHPLLREGVKKILQGDPDIEVVAEAESAPELLTLVARTDVHLLVLDISLPGRDGSVADRARHKNLRVSHPAHHTSMPLARSHDVPQ